MSTILQDLLDGTGALSTHTPNIGSASWVLVSGGELILSGSNTAGSATPNTETVYTYDVPAGTAACQAVADFYFSNGDSTSSAVLRINLQPDGTHYALVLQGNGNLWLMYFDGTAFVVLETYSGLSPSTMPGWWRLDLAHDGAGNFVANTWSSSNRADLGNGPNHNMIDNAGVDGLARITVPGKMGIAVRNAVFGGVLSPGFTDSAVSGPIISTAIQTLTAVNRTTAGVTLVSGTTSGTLYALARTGGSAALAAPIISGGQSNATTGSGAKTVPNTVLATGTANQYVDMVYVDATNGTSNVVTVGPITTASALSFSGTIGTQTVTSGDVVDIDLSSYWSGTGFGSLAYSSIGASIAGTGLSINSSGRLVGTAGAATSISGVQFRKADSGSPVSQADSNAFTLTITSGGGGDTTAPSITSTGTGGTNGPFSATVAENSTATFITFTSDEALASVTKAGTNGASYTLAGTGLTRTLARTSGFDYEAWVLAGSVPEVVTLAFADAAANVRNVTVNISPTNVNELPSAPTIGTATAGDQTVSIAFTAPVNTGKPTITGYTATLSPGGITKTGASSPIVFGAGDGVVNDTAYTGVVKATNSEGIGPDSSASNSVTPTAGAPTGATINSQPLANNNNVLLPDTLLLWVGVRDFLTGDPVALHTSITTDSSAQFSLYDAALNVAGRYLVDWVTEDFQHGRAEAVGE